MSNRTHSATPVYYGPVGMVGALIPIGQVLRLRARAATGRAIRALLNLAPKAARRVQPNGSQTEVPLDVVSSLRPLHES